MNVCEQREDYLNHDLSEKEEIRFLSHLKTCENCRQFVEEQQTIEGLLVEAVQSESVSESLMTKVDQAIIRRRVMKWSASIAALLLLAVGTWWLMREGKQTPRVTQPEPSMPTPEIKVVQEPPSVEVVANTNRDVIVVPIETDDPNITMIWVYPTVPTTKRISSQE